MLLVLVVVVLVVLVLCILSHDLLLPVVILLLPLIHARRPLRCHTTTIAQCRGGAVIPTAHRGNSQRGGSVLLFTSNGLPQRLAQPTRLVSAPIGVLLQGTVGPAMGIVARCRRTGGVVLQQFRVPVAVLHGTRGGGWWFDAAMASVMQSQQHRLPMVEDVDGPAVQGLPVDGQRGLELELLLVPIAKHLAEGGVLGEGGIEALGEGSVQLFVAGHLNYAFLPLPGQGLEQREFGGAGDAGDAGDAGIVIIMASHHWVGLQNCRDCRWYRWSCSIVITVRNDDHHPITAITPWNTTDVGNINHRQCRRSRRTNGLLFLGR